MGENRRCMRYVFPTFLALATVALLGLLLPCHPLPAQQAEELLHRAGFDVDGSAPGWDLDWWSGGGVWNVDGGTLNGQGNAWAAYEEARWGGAGRYIYRFRVNYLAGGLHVNIQAEGERRYAVGLRNENDLLRVNIFKDGPGAEPGVEVLLGDFPISQITPFWVEILVQDGWIGVYVEPYLEEPMLVYEDDDPLPPGVFAFETLEDGVVQIDEVEVWGPPEQEGLSDLIVADVDWQLEDEVDLLEVRVRVRNEGQIESGDSDVYAELISLQEGNTAPLPPLLPGQEEDVFINLGYPRELRGEIVEVFIHVDPGQRVDEMDEENNFAGLEVQIRPMDVTDVPSESTDTPVSQRGDGDDDGEGIDLIILLIIIAGVLTLVLGGLVYGLIRALRGQPGPEPEAEPEKRRPPPIPIPPVRLLRIWLSEGGSGEGAVLHDRHPLRADAIYTLHLQIQPRGSQRETASSGEGKRLRVVLFSPEADFHFNPEPVFLNVPEQGASNEVHYSVRVKRVGHVKLRASVYYGNVLLQSALLEADAIEEGETDRSGSAVSRLTDYVASADLRAPDRLPQPVVSLFTNQASDSSHWIGLFAGGESAPSSFRSGMLHEFGAREMSGMAGELRTLLTDIQGRGRYRFSASSADPQQRVEQLERDLTRLATRGHSLYNALFFPRLGADERADALLHFQELLRDPGVVSVARCRADVPSIPWAALYDLHLDTNAPLALCTVFKQQLVVGQDLLDYPATCRVQADCPLNNDDGLTVCPFGFWGFMHQVEQPLQQVSPTSVDEVPPQLASEAYEQSCRIERVPGDAVEVAVAYYPRLRDVGQHLSDLQALARSRKAHVRTEDERDGVIQGMLRGGGFHLYYFYCHGEVEGNLVRLKLGPADHPGYLAAADLNPRWRLNWRGKPRSLVILNACETVAMVPERVGELMLQLRFLGSGGAVGTEIQVRTELARQVGTQLVKGILDGHSLGEAFLDIRRQLLRQYNPLGLAYAYHAPATLHLHTPGDCEWCRAHLGEGSIQS